jgi:hypothetical protein
MSALPGNSDIDLFRYGQGVINLDAEVSGGAFDLGVAEQELHRPQVTRTATRETALGRGTSGSSLVLDCANDRREYGAASASGDRL